MTVIDPDNYTDPPSPVVICERHLNDGNWKDVLSRLASILNPPRLIVVSHRSDDGLWTEVLNMGGFDLLSAPAHLSTTTPSPHSEQMKASMAANPGGRGIPHMSTESEIHRSGIIECDIPHSIIF